MLLRSLTKHVRDQNWFAVFLDFFIVVAGILIAFQITNWNEERADRDLANRYVVQMVDDIRADIKDIENGIKTSKWRYAALSTLLEKAELAQPDFVGNPELEVKLPPAKFENAHRVEMITAATYTRLLDSDRPTYSSLVSAGNANLLDKTPSFQCIIAYYAAHDEVLKFEGRLLLYRTDLVRAQHQAGVSIAGDVSEDKIIEKIKSDDQLAAALASYRVFSHFHVDVLESLHGQATDLLNTLDANGSNCGTAEMPSL